MKTKGIEAMTREELIEFATSLNEELKDVKDEASKYERWWKVAEEKIQATKLFVKIL